MSEHTTGKVSEAASFDETELKKLKQYMSGLRKTRLPYWEHWRTLADYLLPRRYIFLQSDAERARIKSQSPHILDSTGTLAARTLASGMMNGITSPARPWFKLAIPGLATPTHDAAIWLEEVQKRMLAAMAQSNIYNALSVMYLDLSVFGTAAMIIYEDPENLAHCYNPALGEFYLGQAYNLRVDTFAREFTYHVEQVVKRWGIENCSDVVVSAYKTGGARLMDVVKITHLIRPNVGEVDSRYTHVEYYYESSARGGKLLELQGYYEFPAVTPRWEMVANDAYGSSPGMDALPDIIQLQHETKKKAQGLDKLVSPPLIADIQLKNQPKALLPNGLTYVANSNGVGVKPAYQINVPLAELSEDIANIQRRISRTFHNELFNIISQLDTVRSASEVDALQNEKLVLLGPVLERFEKEGLEPSIKRFFGIMNRRGLLPEAPPELQGVELEIQYTSILAVAQSAVGTAAIERFVQFAAPFMDLFPETKTVLRPVDILLNYGRDLGVSPSNLNARKDIDAAVAAADKQAQEQQQLSQMNEAASGAKLLSETDVGGGANALQRILN